MNMQLSEDNLHYSWYHPFRLFQKFSKGCHASLSHKWIFSSTVTLTQCVTLVKYFYCLHNCRFPWMTINFSPYSHKILQKHLSDKFKCSMIVYFVVWKISSLGMNLLTRNCVVCSALGRTYLYFIHLLNLLGWEHSYSVNHPLISSAKPEMTIVFDRPWNFISSFLPFCPSVPPSFPP